MSLPECGHKRVLVEATENDWSHTGHFQRGTVNTLEKDGYEIFLPSDGGFELNIRDPETGERKIILACERTDGPMHVASLLGVLRHAEKIVSLATNGENN